VIKKGFIILDKLRNVFHMFSNIIDYKILAQDGMRFEKAFKYYSKNQ
jgi:hypothetical protein